MSSSGGKPNKYIYGAGLELRLVSSSEWYAYICDGLGSVRFVLKNGTKDAPNTVYSVTTYKPFGGAIGASGSDRKFAYAGEIQDPTGLVYLGARYYEPELGRFVSLDPLLGSLSSPQTTNRYVYCANNPETCTDPSGAIVDIVFDVACIIWDVWELHNNPSAENWGYLTLDVVCAAIPFLPAIGGVVRLGKGAEKLYEGWRAADKVIDAERAVEKTYEGARAAERAEDFSNFFKWMDEGGDARYIDEANHYSKSQSIFRKGLETRTGIADLKGMEAHHVFPQTFHDIFMKRWGIDVWNPRYGSWVEASAHRHWSPAYNDAWRKFFESPHSIEEVFEYARKLGGMKEYGFKVLF